MRRYYIAGILAFGMIYGATVCAEELWWEKEEREAKVEERLEALEEKVEELEELQEWLDHKRRSKELDEFMEDVEPFYMGEEDDEPYYYKEEERSEGNPQERP